MENYKELTENFKKSLLQSFDAYKAEALKYKNAIKELEESEKLKSEKRKKFNQKYETLLNAYHETYDEYMRLVKEYETTENQLEISKKEHEEMNNKIVSLRNEIKEAEKDNTKIENSIKLYRTVLGVDIVKCTPEYISGIMYSHEKDEVEAFTIKNEEDKMWDKLYEFHKK